MSNLPLDRGVKHDYQHCPVCGFKEPLERWDICVCCGFEAGFDDDRQSGHGGIEGHRTLWLLGGAKWWSDSRPEPAEWNLLKQMTEAGLAEELKL